MSFFKNASIKLEERLCQTQPNRTTGICPQPLDVLLAEDNPVNQQLAVRILEKRGHRVIVADNGKIALECLEKQRFDLILMDMQMPEMDGLNTTAAIREKEKKTGEHISIIAMTAHAMKGDKERCLAAGMDGYVSKPIRVSDLIAAVESIGEDADDDVSNVHSGRVIDMNTALNRLEGDMELFRELAEIFISDCPRLMANAKEAVTRGDGSDIERSAHAIKGAVGNFGAECAHRAALTLEIIGREGNLTRTHKAYRSLEYEIQRLCSTLDSSGSTEEAA